jgi:hypothetical protein
MYCDACAGLANFRLNFVCFEGAFDSHVFDSTLFMKNKQCSLVAIVPGVQSRQRSFQHYNSFGKVSSNKRYFTANVFRNASNADIKAVDVSSNLPVDTNRRKSR